MTKESRPSIQELQLTHNRSYLLRLWREDQSNAADWRASLEDPRTGGRFGFASLEMLFAFLMELCEKEAG